MARLAAFSDYCDDLDVLFQENKSDVLKICWLPNDYHLIAGKRKDAR